MMIAISLAIMFTTGLLIYNRNLNRQVNFGYHLMTISLAIVLLLILKFLFGNDLRGTSIVMKFVYLFLFYFYYITDIYTILDGGYNNAVSVNDHIYGTMKIFSDFIVGFIALIGLFGGWTQGVTD